MSAARLLAVAAVVASLVAGGCGSDDEAAAVSSCEDSDSIDLDCQERYYEDLARDEGVDAAFADLKTAYEEQGFIRAGCHPIVHVIGNAAVELYGSLGEAYAHGDPFCSAGYYHGVTEQLVSEFDSGRLAGEANGVCDDLGGHDRHSIYHRNCAHGLGHGFMAVAQNRLPRALGTCDGLADDWERRSCYGGAFMENVMSIRPDGRGPWLRPDDPLSTCAELDGRYRKMCLQKQTGYALYVRDDDFAAVFELCAEVEDRFQPACHQGLGTAIAVHNLKRILIPEQQLVITSGGCLLGARSVVQANCVTGAVRALINYDHDVERAEEFCRVVPTRLRAGCLQSVEDKRTWPE